MSFTQQIFTESHVRNCSAGKQRLKWIQPRPAGIEFMQGRRRGVLSLSRARPSATPWTAARQASLSITNSWSSLRLTSFESVMPSNHLILCRPLLLLPPIPPSIRVFSNESALCIRWPKYWSFSFRISPSNEYSGRVNRVKKENVKGKLHNDKGFREKKKTVRLCQMKNGLNFRRGKRFPRRGRILSGVWGRPAGALRTSRTGARGEI